MQAAPAQLLQGDRFRLLSEKLADGEKVGTHLRGWTPFRFDVTELARKAPLSNAHEIRMRLDEKVGHGTQGFLAVIEPHFGGYSAPRLLVPVCV